MVTSEGVGQSGIESLGLVITLRIVGCTSLLKTVYLGPAVRLDYFTRSTVHRVLSIAGCLMYRTNKQDRNIRILEAFYDTRSTF